MTHPANRLFCYIGKQLCLDPLSPQFFHTHGPVPCRHVRPKRASSAERQHSPSTGIPISNSSAGRQEPPFVTAVGASGKNTLSDSSPELQQCRFYRNIFHSKRCIHEHGGLPADYTDRQKSMTMIFSLFTSFPPTFRQIITTFIIQNLKIRYNKKIISKISINIPHYNYIY